MSITSLDIFRVGNILSLSLGYELVDINSFLISVPILFPLKKPGNQKAAGKQKASGVFREYKMRVMAQNGLIKFIMQNEDLFRKFHFHHVASGGRVEEGVFHLTVYLVVRFNTAILQTFQLRGLRGRG